jgi:hypothetical protein
MGFIYHTVDILVIGSKYTYLLGKIRLDRNEALLACFDAYNTSYYLLTYYFDVACDLMVLNLQPGSQSLVALKYPSNFMVLELSWLELQFKRLLSY